MIWVDLGHVLFEKGAYDDAVTAYQSAIAIKPDIPVAHNNLAAIFRQRSDLPQALRHYRLALDADPDYAPSLFGLGDVLGREGNFREAAAQWRRGLRVQPDNVPALLSLATVLAEGPDKQLQNRAEAVEMANAAEALIGDREPAMLAEVAVVYGKAERFSKALETASRALGLAEQQGARRLAAAVRAEMTQYAAKARSKNNAAISP